MMRRTVWFVGGVAAGAASAGYAKRKVTAAARKLAPANVAAGAVGIGQAVVPPGRRRRARGAGRGPGPRARAAGRARRPARAHRRPPPPRRRGARRRQPGRVRPGHPHAPARRGRPDVTATARRRADVASATLIDELRRALSPDRVRDGATELSLYRHDASTMEGAAVAVCFPLIDRRRAGLRGHRRAPRRAVRRPRLGHRAGRRGRPARGRGRHLDHEDEPHPVGRRRPAGGRGSSRACSTSTSPGPSFADGLHFAPDPSSQQTCSIGGNVANNSGGPHCLAEGVTNAHILALEVVLPDGTVAVLGGEDPEPLGLRPARRVRRQRGHVRRDDQGARAADAEPAGGVHDADGLRLRRRRRRRRSARSSPPVSCRRRWR